MKRDPGSSYAIAEGLAAKSSTDATENGAAVDHADAPAASFLISAGTVGTSVDAKLQHSDDNSTWTDEEGGIGNDTAITQLTAAGEAVLNAPNPRSRYSRVVVTTAGACVVAVTNISGPLRHVSPS